MCQAWQVYVVVMICQAPQAVTSMKTVLAIVVVVEGLQPQLWVVELCCHPTTCR
jgi:hypothetical protein